MKRFLSLVITTVRRQIKTYRKTHLGFQLFLAPTFLPSTPTLRGKVTVHNITCDAFTKLLDALFPAMTVRPKLHQSD